MNATPMATLLHWIDEREAIRVRKDAGEPFPWTGDRILGTYRFCNVRREDDRVTVWIRENIRARFADNKNLWFMLCIARQINWPDTLRVLIASGNYAWPVDDRFEPRILGEVLDGLALLGKKVFTGAYIVTAPQTKGAKKTTFIAEKTLGALWRDRAGFAPLTMYGAHNWLMRYDGWGPFLAYQAVVDMRFCPRLLENAPDVGGFTAAGPGTLRGLNRLEGKTVDVPINQRAAADKIRRLHAELKTLTSVTMDLSDVPNVLCEFDKYSRVLHGQGKPRALYVPGRGS